jgi:hypothetical protein
MSEIKIKQSFGNVTLAHLNRLSRRMPRRLTTLLRRGSKTPFRIRSARNKVAIAGAYKQILCPDTGLLVFRCISVYLYAHETAFVRRKMRFFKD